MSRRRSGSSAAKPRHRQHQAPVATAASRRQPVAAVAPTGGAPKVAEAVEPEALAVTYAFDPGDEGEPYDVALRLSGRRVGVRGTPRAGDSFSKDESFEGIVPSTGPVSITAWVYGLQPGEWDVDGRLIPSHRKLGSSGTGPTSPPALRRATWSWRRWGLADAPAGPIKTRWAVLAPLARQPAVIPGVYTALALAGFVLALGLQAVILSGRGTPVGPPLATSVAALLFGLVGAKVWYKVLHPEDPWFKGGGWAVDGFLVVAPLVAAVTMFATGVPIGVVLDATAPGIFFAVALGRVGCFLTGCCAGRCTASSWGVWSSDRRMGARRIPTQLLESAAGLALALASLIVVVNGGLPIAGGVFLGAFVIYAIVRQGLLRLRAERRKEYRTLPLTAAAAGVVTVVIATLSIVQGP